MITKDMFIREIRKQILRINEGKQYDFNFLGFVEADSITWDVEIYFKVVTEMGRVYYNWIDGNRMFQGILKGMNKKTTIKEIKKILK